MKLLRTFYLLASVIFIPLHATCPLSDCDDDATGTSGKPGWSTACYPSGSYWHYIMVKYDRANYIIYMYADENWQYCGGSWDSDSYWYPVYTDYDWLDAEYYNTSYEWGEVNAHESGKQATHWAKAKVH